MTALICEQPQLRLGLLKRKTLQVGPRNFGKPGLCGPTCEVEGCPRRAFKERFAQARF